MATEIGKLIAHFEADTHKFDGPLRGSKANVNALERELMALGVRISSVTGGLSGLGSALTVAAGGFAAVGAVRAYTNAVLDAHTALFTLTKTAADFGSKIHDVAQEVGSTAETVSTFAYAAKLSGKNLEDLTPGIKRFELTIGDAAKGSKTATEALKRLGVDPKQAINDLDGALSTAIKTIHDAGTGITQVNLAADAFGKKSGPAMISSIETMNGNFKQFQLEARGVGAVLSTEAANAADEFGDKLDELTTRVKFLGIQFGTHLIPTVSEGLDIINRLITDTPKTTAIATGLIKSQLEYNVLFPLREVEAILNILERPRTIPVNIALTGPTAMMAFILGQGAGKGPTVGGDVAIGAGILRKAQEGIIRPPVGGGGGRGGGARSDPGLMLLKQLEEQFKALTPRTELQITMDRLLDDQYKRTTDSIKKRIMVTAIEIDQMKAAQADFDAMANLVRELGEQGVAGFVRGRKASGDFFDTAIPASQKFNDEIEKMIGLVTALGEKGETGFRRLRYQVDILKNTRLRTAGILPEGDRDSISLGGGSFAKRDTAKSIDDLLNSTRSRFASIERQVLSDHIQRVQAQMEDLGYELTGIFSSSFRDGIERGGLQGLASFGLQLAHVVEVNFLQKIANSLGDFLGSAATGGKGSFWTGLLKAVGISTVGAVAGGFGPAPGGSVGRVLAGAIGRDTGGPIWPDTLYKVHKDEYIMPTGPGYVVPKGGMSGPGVVHNHYNTFKIESPKGQSYQAPRSGRQQAEMIASILASQLT